MNNSSSKRSRAVFQLDAASALTLNTITLMTFMAASSAPTPLYRLYQQLWQFSPVTLTLIFATYAFTLLGSLLIIGSLSDYIGRRPVIIAAISLQIISMSFFGTVAKLAMRQPFVLFKGLTFQKLCLPGAFRPGDHHNKMLRPGLCVVHASPQYL
ncbi:hypothetical protein MASRES_GEN13593_00630 [Acinetobacter baumannii]